MFWLLFVWHISCLCVKICHTKIGLWHCVFLGTFCVFIFSASYKWFCALNLTHLPFPFFAINITDHWFHFHSLTICYRVINPVVYHWKPALVVTEHCNTYLGISCCWTQVLLDLKTSIPHWAETRIRDTNGEQYLSTFWSFLFYKVKLILCYIFKEKVQLLLKYLW